jgi:5-methylcytosine-specific restriction endonuclease McrA
MSTLGWIIVIIVGLYCALRLLGEELANNPETSPKRPRTLGRSAPKREIPKQFWPTYKHYLDSEIWAHKRRQALRRDGEMCTRCGGAATEIHHLSYPNVWGTEDIEKLTSLCTSCHTREHLGTNKEGRSEPRGRSRIRQRKHSNVDEKKILGALEAAEADLGGQKLCQLCNRPDSLNKRLVPLAGMHALIWLNICARCQTTHKGGGPQ